MMYCTNGDPLPKRTGDVISALSHVQPVANKVKRSGKWKDPFHANKL
jgi:hypothetical protein